MWTTNHLTKPNWRSRASYAWKRGRWSPSSGRLFGTPSFCSYCWPSVTATATWWRQRWPKIWRMCSWKRKMTALANSTRYFLFHNSTYYGWACNSAVFAWKRGICAIKCLRIKYNKSLAMLSYFWLILPMVRHCIAYGSSNRSNEVGCENLSWHSLPLRDPKLLQTWLIKIEKENTPVNKNSFLCSKHFQILIWQKIPKGVTIQNESSWRAHSNVPFVRLWLNWILQNQITEKVLELSD